MTNVCFVSPIGQGSLFLGAYRGFKDLLAAGLIAKLPRMIGVQSVACAPIVEAIKQGLDHAAPIEKQPSVAEGIALAHPIRANRETVEWIVPAWRSRSSMLGQPVVFVRDGAETQAIAEDVGPNGALIVRTSDGTRIELIAGEVERLRFRG